MKKAVRDRRGPDGPADVVPTQKFGSLPRDRTILPEIPF